MRERNRRGWLVPASLLTMLAFCSVPASAQMQLPGSFAVNDRGAATYTLPIRVPPGVAGIEPKLELVYNSQRGNGLLGVGWSLSGLSAIARCPQTIAQDPVSVGGSVNFDAADRFCLDGRRLVVVAGAYGAAASEYRTELESFSKITAVGSAGGNSANGPEQFVVKTKDGLTMTYGGTADSRVEAQGKTAVAVWSLSKVNDIKGNSLAITYTEDSANGVSYPARIDYTSNATTGLAAANVVYFDYETRPDVVVAYHAGSASSSTKRMSKVRTAIGGGATAVAEYQLAYQASFSDRKDSFVQTVRLCDALGACSLLPTTWTFAVPAANFSGQDMGTGGGLGYWDGYDETSHQRFHFTGDFDGDGRTDFMYWTSAGWRVLLNNGSQFVASDWGPGGKRGYLYDHYTSSTQEFHFTGDFNGDTKTDFMYWEPTGWRVLLSTGSGWVGADWGAGGKLGYWSGHHGASSQQFHFTGDFNGDGKTDFMYWEQTGWRVLLSTGSGWLGQDWGAGGKLGHWSGHAGSSSQPFHLLGDFNGDGKTDFMYLEQTSWRVLLSTGSGWIGQDWGAGGKLGYWSGHAGSSNQSFHITGDFNADGKTDFMYWEQVGWRVLLSTGAGWAGSDWGNGGKRGYWSGHSGSSNQSFHFPADFNGDGKTDFMYWDQVGWRVLFSTGFGWIGQDWGIGAGPGYWTGHTQASNQPFQFAGDFNGQGKASLLYFGNGTAPVWKILFNDGLLAVDTIKQGLGSGVALTTRSLPQLGGAYQRGHAVSSPRLVITPPMPVVTEARQVGVTGESRVTRYFYNSAVAEIGTGRGFLGFAAVTAKDEEFGTWTHTTYRLDWPFTGLVTGRTIIERRGVEPLSFLVGVSDMQTQHTCQNPATAPETVAPGAGAAVLAPGLPGNCTVAPGSRYQVWASRITEKHDLSGLEAQGLPGTRTEVSDMDKYGNAARVRVDALLGDGSASGHYKVTDTLYSNDAANWILGRPLRSSVKAVAP